MFYVLTLRINLTTDQIQQSFGVDEVPSFTARHNKHYTLLRGKQLVVIIGQKKAF
jgi:hypothetical protein